MFETIDFDELLDKIDDFYLRKVNLKKTLPYMYENVHKASYAIAYYTKYIDDRNNGGMIDCVTGGVLMATRDLFSSRSVIYSIMAPEKLEENISCERKNIVGAYKRIEKGTKGKSLEDFLEMYEKISAESGNNRMVLKFEPKPDKDHGKMPLADYHNPYIHHDHKKRKV